MNFRLLFPAWLAWCLLASADARVSTNYTLHVEALDTGGHATSSISYNNAGSIGLIAGTSTSATYSLEAGFLPQISSRVLTIAVFDGANSEPANERESNSASFSFATTPIGSATPQVFTISNTGTNTLTGLTLAKAGVDTADFTLSPLGATSLVPGATTTFTVTFSPTMAGARSAAVQIASSDPEQSPFVVNVLGNDLLMATYINGTEVPVAANEFTATSSTLNLALNYAPATGTALMVVKNTGLDFIQGRFNNLAHGQMVSLSFAGTTYNFIANYYGSSGNDLMLVWAATRPFAWGNNGNGQLGDNSMTPRLQPVSVSATGVLAGRTVLALANGAAHSVALCSDGTLAAWGKNDLGQLGDGTMTQRYMPVAVTKAGTPLATKTVVAIAVGDSHNLALCSDGTVAAWGYNAGGQLGDGSVQQRLLPVAVTTMGTPLAGKTVTAVAAGRHHSLALCSDGTLAAWGLNAYGQLGDNTTMDRHLPVAVNTAGTPLAGKTVVALAAGAYHSLALCSDSTLAAWGHNSNGQLGDNSWTQQNVAVAVATAGTPLASKTIATIAAGATHNLALCLDGTLAAWGNNSDGQLGYDFSGQQSMPVVAVNKQPGISALFGKTVVGIAAGAAHSMALCSDGTLSAWGYNANGQLGDNSIIPRSLPVAVDAGTLAAAERFTAVFGGSSSDHTLALAASPPAPEIAVFTGTSTSLVDERQNNVGNLGFPTTQTGLSSSTQTFTIKNTGLANMMGLSLSKAGAHPDDFTLGVIGATTLAPGATTTFSVAFSPTAADARSAVILITSNDEDENPFVINLSGTGLVPMFAIYNAASDVPVTASSYTAMGKAVNFTLNFAPSPGMELMVVKNTGLDFINGTFSNLAQGQPVALSFAGSTYNFVANYYGGSGNDLVLVVANTRSFAWGQNANGQLGDNTITQRNLPVPVTATGMLAGKTVVAHAIGQTHSLALCSDGTLAAWGQNNYGQLGDGTTAQSQVPVPVTQAGTPLAGKMVVAIAAGTFHSLALCSDGTVATWGYNSSGQLGDATTVNRLTPVAVTTAGTPLAGKTVVSVAAGYLYSLALCSDGTVASWGYNANGQLGNGTYTLSTVPRAVLTNSALFGKTVVAISANVNHTLAVCSDGTLAAWGFNFAGELGDNTTTSRLAPVAVLQHSGSALFGKSVIAAAAGEHHSLALCSDGTLASWGQNNSGQLGNGFTIDRRVAGFVTRAGTALEDKTVVAIAAGTSHSLALCTDGTLAAWGKNNLGQLGDNTTSQRNVPVAVNTSTLEPNERYIRLFSGSYADHTIAINVSGPGMSAQENWRLNHFGSPDNSGAGADLNDFDQDGLANVLEFGFGLDPTQNSAGELPQPRLIDNNLVINFTEPAGMSGITYSAEWSTSLQPASWTSTADTGFTPQHTFSIAIGTNTTLFVRLKITSP